MRTEGMSSTQREDLMDQVKQQIVIANTQELLTVRDDKGWRQTISYRFAFWRVEGYNFVRRMLRE